MSDSIVYVVQNQHRSDVGGELKPKFDIEPAQKFGELRFLLSPSARPFRTDSIIQELHRKLRDYRGDRDYLLLLGNPCLIGLTVAVAAFYGDGRVRFLQWNGRRHGYVAIEADVGSQLAS